MKTRINKTIMIAVALIFVGSGVAFAHDWKGRNHKPPGKAHGHYKVQKNHPGWTNKNFKPNPYYSQRYVFKEIRDHRYYDDHYWRPAPRRDVIYKVAQKNPIVVFKIIVNDHR